jgi:hypothetical protein
MAECRREHQGEIRTPSNMDDIRQRLLDGVVRFQA